MKTLKTWVILGIGISINCFSQSLELENQKAQNGDATAQYQLANRYAYGNGVPIDTQKAAFWYQQAANKGLAIAQYKLGKIYESGEGVIPDQYKAIAWYKKAAEQRYPPAEFSLAVAYERGFGVQKNDQLAAFWYLQAAENGVQAAQYSIGISYMQGRGVAIDLLRSDFWLTVASLGRDEGICQLAKKFKTIADTNLSQQEIELNLQKAKAFLDKLRETEDKF